MRAGFVPIQQRADGHKPDKGHKFRKLGEMDRNNRVFRWQIALAISLALAGRAARAEKPNEDFSRLSLDDLMNVEVTSVSKHAERIAEAPAAVTVISQDEIRRSGMNSIPELLRLSPGLEV